MGVLLKKTGKARGTALVDEASITVSQPDAG
jgi:hypothetical protein